MAERDGSNELKADLGSLRDATIILGALSYVVGFQYQRHFWDFFSIDYTQSGAPIYVVLFYALKAGYEHPWLFVQAAGESVLITVIAFLIFALIRNWYGWRRGAAYGLHVIVEDTIGVDDKRRSRLVVLFTIFIVSCFHVAAEAGDDFAKSYQRIDLQKSAAPQAGAPAPTPQSVPTRNGTAVEFEFRRDVGMPRPILAANQSCSLWLVGETEKDWVVLDDSVEKRDIAYVIHKDDVVATRFDLDSDGTQAGTYCVPIDGAASNRAAR